MLALSVASGTSFNDLQAFAAHFALASVAFWVLQSSADSFLFVQVTGHSVVALRGLAVLSTPTVGSF